VLLRHLKAAPGVSVPFTVERDSAMSYNEQSMSYEPSPAGHRDDTHNDSDKEYWDKWVEVWKGQSWEGPQKFMWDELSEGQKQIIEMNYNDIYLSVTREWAL
jgi:hypothetical protein